MRADSGRKITRGNDLSTGTNEQRARDELTAGEKRPNYDDHRRRDADVREDEVPASGSNARNGESEP